ncbi:hypothetical protein AXX17_AT5G14540 [Arabidopsis thaliana]|uniref:Uncharacterized protein n=1 Tax=Arabidopsis thaliana TaxID=3702 RepID=A0A178UJ54_ARATH|nr:hypothetical protein AXX17_AT5G14540 [Arabidopsis thaliana]
MRRLQAPTPSLHTGLFLSSLLSGGATSRVPKLSSSTFQYPSPKKAQRIRIVSGGTKRSNELDHIRIQHTLSIPRPVGGCHEYIFHLRTQIALVTAELRRTRDQITAAFFNPTAASFFNSAANNFLDPSSAVNPFRNLTANNDDGTIEFLSGGGYCGNFVGSNLSHANANENDVNLEALEQEQLGGAPRNNDIERVFREFFTDEEIMSLLEAQVSRHKCAYQSMTKDDDFPFP